MNVSMKKAVFLFLTLLVLSIGATACGKTTAPAGGSDSGGFLPRIAL